jgi:uncharacterized membrane protein YfcA
LPDVSQIVVAVLAMFVGATVAGTVGFGLGMMATPVLLLVLDPQSAVLMVNTAGIAVYVIVICQTRRYLPIKAMAPIGLAGLAGAPLGVYLLSSVSASALRISITVLILITAAAVTFNVGWSMGRARLLGPPLGLVVGALVSGFGIGGPLMVLYLLNHSWSSDAMRASLAFYFLLIMSTGIVGYGISGLYTAERIALVMMVAIPVLVGFGLSGLLLRRMNERSFRRGVIGVIVLTSIMVLTRELLSL